MQLNQFNRVVLLRKTQLPIYTCQQGNTLLKSYNSSSRSVVAAETVVAVVQTKKIIIDSKVCMLHAT